MPPCIGAPGILSSVVMSSRPHSRSGSRLSGSVHSHPDGVHYPDPHALGDKPKSNSHVGSVGSIPESTGKRSHRSHRTGSKVSHRSSAVAPSVVSSKGTAGSTSSSRSKPLLRLAFNASRLSSFEIEEPAKPTKDEGISKKIFYGVIAAAVIAIIAVGLIAHFSSTCSGVAAPAVATTPKPTVTPAPPSSNAYRLPSNLRPVSYSLSLKVYLPDALVAHADENRFDGNYSVQFMCVNPTSQIVFHSVGLNLTASSFALASVGGADAGLTVTRAYSLNNASQTATIGLSRACVAGSAYVLSLQYRAVLNKDLFGFYLSTYTEKGVLRSLAVTQFEASDARKAFPCWDEPAFKANFSVQLTAPVQYQSLSNGIQTKNVTVNGWRTTTFSTTPSMSSYLVAFAVLDFDFEERVTPDGAVRFRIWARRDLKPYLKYAADVGAQALTLYSKLFGIPFPLPKQDMLAIPDFDAGAMENWGLVTYRETLLIYDAANNGFKSRTRQAVANTIVHELAHQWFGDLVTMAWWNDLFLNEGFADYIEYIGADQISINHREFGMDYQFVEDDTDPAMVTDQMLSSHPVALSPSNSHSYFDVITYEKGGALLKMLNFTLTKPTFIKGLHNYLTKYAYGNTNHNQLWAKLTGVAQGVQDWNGKALNVTTFMNPWVEQMGFPLVTANRSGNTVTLTQQRFLIDDGKGTKPSPSPYNYQWYVPIWYQAGSFASQLLWLTPNKPTTIQLSDSAAKAPFFALNYQTRGFYRSHYDAASWTAIKNQLVKNPNAFDVRSRAQFVDDAFNLAMGGKMSYASALGIVSYLKGETHYVPWVSASSSLSFFNDMFALDINYQIYRNYMLNLINGVYNNVGWDTKTDNASDFRRHYMRTFAIGEACNLEQADCTTHARSLYKAMLTDCQYSKTGSFQCSMVPGDLKRTVYCRLIAEGTAGDWNWMWKLFLAEQMSEERNNLMKGLSCTREPWLLRRLLAEGLSAAHIRSQDVRYTFQFVGQNPVGKEMLWNFLTLNWESIRVQYAQTFGFSVARIVRSATSSFNTQYQVNELRTFIATHQLGTAAQSFTQALDRAQTNLHWMTRFYQPVLAAMNATLTSSQRILAIA